ncbi:MAG TPA: hypothetical protein VGB44_11445 [Flavobacterium sp.]|jgi:cytochrome c553
MMKRICVLLIVIAINVGCGKVERIQDEQPSVSKTSGTKEFKMYELSEMSMLMEQMYVDNERLKDRISKGDTIGQFPTHFLEIHKAALTDESENDKFFKEQAAIFIKAQRLVYEDPKNAAIHYNKGIDACVRCHEAKCGGPIPRIKKLYIKG